MAKDKISFKCVECGASFPKYAGKCFNCGVWGSLKEETSSSNSFVKKGAQIRTAVRVGSLDFSKEHETHKFNFPEINRCIGDGISADGVYLVAGEPGIGKSTLVLQLAEKLASGDNTKILIVTGEETVTQVAKRFNRLGLKSENILVCESRSYPDIEATILNEKPRIVFIDSIQVIHHPDASGSAGGVSQVRFIAAELSDLAKQHKISLFILAHVTKDGDIAGPKALEHIVDVVLQFEGDRKSDLRFIRSTKNRFGPTDEVAILQMTEKGLIPPENLLKFLIPNFGTSSVGVAHSVVLEGKRPIPVEVQVLSVPSSYGYPARIVTGYDKNRVQTLIAVLEKYAKFKFSAVDIYMSFTGGIRVTDIACDLAICAALVSSLSNLPSPANTFFVSEVTLSGKLNSGLGFDSKAKWTARLKGARISGPGDVVQISEIIKVF